jgi:hypothetical protein
LTTTTPQIDSSGPSLHDLFPPARPSVAANVSGNGSIETTIIRKGRLLRGAGAAPKTGRIRCGTSGFLCYTQFTGRETLRFVAKPDPGYRFQNWGGACFGQGSTCTITVKGPRSLTANFAPINPAVASIRLNQPKVSIHWHRSVGTGQLTVSGTVSKAALLQIQFRRPTGGPLITQQVSVPAGAFKLTPQIAKGVLPKGAVVLPGGFVVALSGTTAGVALPRAFRTIVLPPPPEGVVRRSFTSRSAGGKTTGALRFGATKAYATFVFASQPVRGKGLEVRWYSPNGKLLGTKRKPNRPTVETSISSSLRLAKGAWRVTLVAGKTVIATHAVSIK